MFDSTSVGPPATKKDAALWWHKFGFTVFPVETGQKVPACKLKTFWLKDYSSGQIRRHWEEHPDHDIGLFLAAGLVVFDTDSDEGTMKLETILASHNIKPSYIEETRKGRHYIFGVKEGVYAPSSTDSSERNPGFIDVIGAGRQVTVTPSSNKKVISCTAMHIDELAEIGQETVDAVFLMNNKPAPRLPEVPTSTKSRPGPTGETLHKIKELLDHVDPDMGHDDWVRVGMAIFYESGGNDEGYELFDMWSSGGSSYKGRAETRLKWKSFRTDVPNPVTLGTLIQMAKEAGADVRSIVSPDFEQCETVVVDQQRTELVLNPLGKFSLTGQSAELEKFACEEVYLLGNLALSGQITLFYAPPNSGKTLITFHMLFDAISRGLISAQNVCYLNLDDSSKGLIEKLRLAEEYGFEMLAEGYNGFKAKTFPDIIRGMVERDQARGIVLIVDTLKKVVDLMHKKQSSDIASIFRQFVLKGGTVICLAHTNKRRDGNNKLVYAGTSDFVDDSDCAYTLGVIESPSDPSIKVVEFVNIKRRGNVAERAAYCYSTERDISYNELLLSVEPFDNSKVKALKQANVVRSDAEIISVVNACICEGVNTKMNLANEAARRAGISRKSAIEIIERYTGNNPNQHHWYFTVRERGKQVFDILKRAET